MGGLKERGQGKIKKAGEEMVGECDQTRCVAAPSADSSFH